MTERLYEIRSPGSPLRGRIVRLLNRPRRQGRWEVIAETSNGTRCVCSFNGLRLLDDAETERIRLAFAQ